MVHSTTLYHGSLVSITDICCRLPESADGAEEQASSHQLVFTRSGVFVKHSGRRRVVAEPTQAIFFNQGETYRVTHPVLGGDDCTAIRCAPNVAREIVSSYDPTVQDREDGPFAVSEAVVQAPVLLRYQRLRQALRARETSSLEVDETAIDIVHDVLSEAYRARAVRSRAKRDSTVRARRALASETKLVLASRPTQTASLPRLAREVCSSPYHLSRVFRHEVGMPIHQYLLRLRLALALERLADYPSGLSLLALDLGFSSHSHFTTLFRRTFGAPPSSFRRSRVPLAELSKKLQA